MEQAQKMNSRKSKVLVRLDEGVTHELNTHVTPRDVARILGIDKMLDRNQKRHRNEKFMEGDRVEDEEMMNRLKDGEDF